MTMRVVLNAVNDSVTIAQDQRHGYEFKRSRRDLANLGRDRDVNRIESFIEPIRQAVHEETVRQREQMLQKRRRTLLARGFL